MTDIVNLSISQSAASELSRQSSFGGSPGEMSIDLVEDKNCSEGWMHIKLKPGTFNEKQSLKDDKDLPKEIFGILLPPKKPLVVKKKSLRTAKKTKYYSERDFEFAKQAIRFMEKSNWKDAKNTAKKARAQSIYDFIEWRHLLTSGNKATFSEYKRFIERVKDYLSLIHI